jgi:hypothetical protein
MYRTIGPIYEQNTSQKKTKNAKDHVAAARENSS